MNWYKFDDGNSIGTRGSEQGIIIEDIEHIKGARVTLEKDGDIAPYAITLGIYGLMFHTHFTGSEEKAHVIIEFAKSKIDQTFDLYEVPETERDVAWNYKFSLLMKELSEQ